MFKKNLVGGGGGRGGVGGGFGGGGKESRFPLHGMPPLRFCAAASPTSSSPRASTRATPDSGQDASSVEGGSGWPKTDQNAPELVLVSWDIDPPASIICLEEFVPEGAKIIDRFYWPVQRGSIEGVQVWVRYVSPASVWGWSRDAKL